GGRVIADHDPDLGPPPEGVVAELDPALVIDVRRLRGTPGDLFARPVFDDLGFQFDIHAAGPGYDPVASVAADRPHIGHEKRKIPELPPEGVEFGSGPVDHGGLDGRGGVIPLMYVVVQKSCRRHVCVGASGLSLHGFSPGSGEARTPPPILVSRALWRGLEQAWSVSGQTAPSL